MERDFFMDLYQKFLEYLGVEKRYSPNTITSYARDLEDFKLFVLKTEGSLSISRVNKKIIRNFMISLSEKNLSKRSINRKLSSLRTFFTFLLKIGEITVSPLETIESLKFYPIKQSPLSEAEMQTLQTVMEEDGEFLSRAIIETLYQTGIRRAELCNLTLENTDFELDQIKVTGKGNKTRIIPISSDLKSILQQYATLRKPDEKSKTFFFINKKGKKITEKFVYLTVTSYLSLVTSKDKKSPHILRHSFATHVLNNGAEISKVQKIMGHSSLASTQVYTDANIEQLKKIYTNSHPRAKKNEEEA